MKVKKNALVDTQWRKAIYCGTICYMDNPPGLGFIIVKSRVCSIISSGALLNLTAVLACYVCMNPVKVPHVQLKLFLPPAAWS